MLLNGSHSPTFAGSCREPQGRTPMVAPAVLLVVCALGGVVSGLSTRDHVRFRVSGGTQAGTCAALIDSGCKAAHLSEAAELLGVPISHFGSAFYLAGAGLAILALSLRERRASPQGPAAGVAPLVALMGMALGDGRSHGRWRYRVRCASPQYTATSAGRCSRGLPPSTSRLRNGHLPAMQEDEGATDPNRARIRWQTPCALHRCP